MLRNSVRTPGEAAVGENVGQTRSSHSSSISGISRDHNRTESGVSTSPYVQRNALRQESRSDADSRNAYEADKVPTAQTGGMIPWSPELAPLPETGQIPPNSNDSNLGSIGLDAPLRTSEATSGFPPWEDYTQGNIGFGGILPLPEADGLDPFSGFDIPFLLGQDQYSGMVNEWT